MGITLLYVLFIVVGLRFFPPAQIGAVLFIIALFWLLYEMIRTTEKRTLAVPAFAALIGLSVWIMDSALLFKALPLLISALFLVKFGEAVFYNKPFLAKMVQKTPRMQWSEEKLAYIDSAHLYWMIVSGINTLIQVIVLFAPIEIWALYTPLGWYLLFGSALGAQIIYGKIHGVK
ncbi:MAG: hypothetical protein DRG24_00155 [Epsilonproteobacteria bacterium]|nr:MAG: hypothetical protein DRG24_00155 [Campylobacterota bacterium]